jgi:hypothetical protein
MANTDYTDYTDFIPFFFTSLASLGAIAWQVRAILLFFRPTRFARRDGSRISADLSSLSFGWFRSCTGSASSAGLSHLPHRLALPAQLFGAHAKHQPELTNGTALHP